MYLSVNLSVMKAASQVGEILLSIQQLFQSSVELSNKPMRRLKLIGVIRSARNEAIAYCNQKLKGSQEIKRTIRDATLMAIENETARVKRQNLDLLQNRKNEFGDVIRSVTLFGGCDFSSL